MASWTHMWSLFLVAVVCIATTCDGRPPDNRPVKWYDVDLNQPPGLRWQKVLEDHKQYIPGVLQMIKDYVPPELIPLVQQIGQDIDHLIPSPFAQEIIGAADYWGLDIGDAVLLNILYDLTAFCTSIVAQDKNGTIWHGRNLDYSEADLLRNITVGVNFKLGNQTLYSGVTYAGYMGLLTGQRPNGFTVTVDQRGLEDRDTDFLYNVLTAIADKNSNFVSFLIRQTLEQESVYFKAVDRLAYTVIHAPVYIIVGGSKFGEGAVLTRDRVAVLDRYELDPLQGRWYVLETNYDRWQTPPTVDGQRRVVAHREMDKLGAYNVNGTALYNVLSTPPVLNSGTTYTVIFSAAQPEVFNAHVRWPPKTNVSSTNEQARPADLPNLNNFATL